MSALPLDAPKGRRLYISLRVKLLVGFTLLFTVVFAGAFYWFYSFATADALASIKSRLTDTINGAVAGINGDQFQELVSQGKRNAKGRSDDPAYAQELNWLATVHSIEPRAYPYSYIKGEDAGAKKTNLFIVDYLQIADPTRAAAFRETWTLNSGQSRDGLTQISYKMDPYTDKWGSWVSAYAPIKNSKGQVVGALGIDFRADYVYQVQRAILDKVVQAFGITYAVLFILVFLISRTLTGPIRALTRAAKQIGEGDYDQDLSFLRRGLVVDEIGTMSEVFDSMAAKISQREQTLKRKVEQLTIEIDESKRSKEVSEIVDSDFFQNLQDKAKMMRSRRENQSGQQPSS